MKRILRKIHSGWLKIIVRFPIVDTLVARPIESVVARERDLLSRRPHRSFRRTRRRDYARSLDMPSYWGQTVLVWRHLMQYKRIFLFLAVIYGILSVILVGLASQSTFNELSTLIKQSNFLSGGWGSIGQAGLLLLAGVTGGLGDPNATSTQGVFAFILALMVWLTTVWLVRAQLAGGKPHLRDGLYQAGAPILPLFIIAFYGALQLIPAALGVIIATAAMGYGDKAGALGMLVWIVAILLGVLSLYWLTSTFIAMIVVTLPGMYPLRAMRTAGDLVIGRRIRILLRILWGFFVLALGWIIIMIPIILIDVWLSSVWTWLTPVPIVPIALLLLTTLSLIWLAAYIYMIYRRIVDDNSPPS